MAIITIQIQILTIIFLVDWCLLPTTTESIRNPRRTKGTVGRVPYSQSH